jgi:hypothetical protein
MASSRMVANSSESLLARAGPTPWDKPEYALESVTRGKATESVLDWINPASNNSMSFLLDQLTSGLRL